MVSSTPLEGKRAVITGASAGIGRETAHVLARDGASVALAARREEMLQEIADNIENKYNVEAIAIPTDVTDSDQVDRLFTETTETFGGIDAVVSNAGIGTNRTVTVEEMPTEQYYTVTDVNIDGMFFTARTAIPYLRKSKGTIVFVGSFAGRYPRPHGPVYAATKWWTRGFALSLAGQVGTDDIAVTLINPGAVRTEFGREYRDHSIKERYEEGETTEPRDVAEVISTAVHQEVPNTIAEIDLYARDKLSSF